MMNNLNKLNLIYDNVYNFSNNLKIMKDSDNCNIVYIVSKNKLSKYRDIKFIGNLFLECYKLNDYNSVDIYNYYGNIIYSGLSNTEELYYSLCKEIKNTDIRLLFKCKDTEEYNSTQILLRVYKNDESLDLIATLKVYTKYKIFETINIFSMHTNDWVFNKFINCKIDYMGKHIILRHNKCTKVVYQGKVILNSSLLYLPLSIYTFKLCNILMFHKSRNKEHDIHIYSVDGSNVKQIFIDKYESLKISSNYKELLLINDDVCKIYSLQEHRLLYTNLKIKDIKIDEHAFTTEYKLYNGKQLIIFK